MKPVHYRVLQPAAKVHRLIEGHWETESMGDEDCWMDELTENTQEDIDVKLLD